MSFTWSSVTAGVTNLLPVHFNELQTNINTLATKLGISYYSWTKLPVSTGQVVEYDAMIEIRNALDYIDNNNVCSTHYTTYNATHNNALNSTHNNNVETTNNSTNHSSYNSNVETGNLATDYTSYRNDHDATVRTTHNTSPK